MQERTSTPRRRRSSPPAIRSGTTPRTTRRCRSSRPSTSSSSCSSRRRRSVTTAPRSRACSARPTGSGTRRPWRCCKYRMLMVLWQSTPTTTRCPGSTRSSTGRSTGARPGAIILMHDAGGDRAETVAALPLIIRGPARARLQAGHGPAAAARQPGAGRPGRRSAAGRWRLAAAGPEPLARALSAARRRRGSSSARARARSARRRGRAGRRRTRSCPR